MSVTGSTLSNNFGGGISNSGTATISQSTLNGNSAELGGGVFEPRRGDHHAEHARG